MKKVSQPVFVVPTHPVLRLASLGLVTFILPAASPQPAPAIGNAADAGRDPRAERTVDDLYALALYLHHRISDVERRALTAYGSVYGFFVHGDAGVADYVGFHALSARFRRLYRYQCVVDAVCDDSASGERHDHGDVRLSRRK